MKAMIELLDFLKADIVHVNCMFQKVCGQSLKMNRMRYLKAICNTFKSYLFVNSHKADECCLSLIISGHLRSSLHLQSAV